MGGGVDSDKPVDPETEREVQSAMDNAVEDMRDEGAASLARYLRNSYTAFRKQGFSRRHAFTFTVILFQNLLAHG